MNFDKVGEIEMGYPPVACRLKLGAQGMHEFGGCRRSLRISGAKLPKPLHHFLTLDLKDPFCPVRAKAFSRLPLLYPLLYGAGGGEIQYKVISDDEVQIFHLSEVYADDPYVDHNELPARRARLVPLSYTEERLLCARQGGFARKLSTYDRWLLAGCDKGLPFRVGGELTSCQGNIWAKCRNPGCQVSDNVPISIVAVIPASSFQLGDVWGQFSDDVEFCFGLCPYCGTVHAENRCT